MSPTSYHCSTPRRPDEYTQLYGMRAIDFLKEAFVWRPNGPGTGLFSRGLVTPVSWALERFTTVFGMGTGGTTPL